jgi:hypothetical protein
MKQSPQGGNPDDIGGNEMESEEMKESPPMGQDRRCIKAWERVFVVANGFQEIRTPTNNDVPSRDTRTNQIYMYNVRWKSRL